MNASGTRPGGLINGSTFASRRLTLMVRWLAATLTHIIYGPGDSGARSTDGSINGITTGPVQVADFNITISPITLRSQVIHCWNFRSLEMPRDYTNFEKKKLKIKKKNFGERTSSPKYPVPLCFFPQWSTRVHKPQDDRTSSVCDGPFPLTDRPFFPSLDLAPGL